MIQIEEENYQKFKQWVEKEDLLIIDNKEELKKKIEEDSEVKRGKTWECFDINY